MVVIIAIKFFLTIFLSTFIPQIVKIILSRVKRTNESFMEILAETGGMPSSHASLMAAMTTMVFLFEGFSITFFLTFSLSMIVLRDAVGVRFAVGEQARTINSIIDSVERSSNHPAKKDKNLGGFTDMMKKVKIVKGHKISEVSVGIVVGIIISLGIFYLL